MSTDLSTLSTDQQLALLRSQLDALSGNGRSPQFSKGTHPSNPRQLMDLRKLPRADDPRPTFFWSAEESREGQPERPPYRKLMWAPDGHEICITSEQEEAEKLKQGYVLLAPANAEAPDTADAIRAQLNALSPEDRKVMLASAQKARRAKLEERMAEMTDEDFEAILDSLEQPKKRTA